MMGRTYFIPGVRPVQSEPTPSPPDNPNFAEYDRSRKKRGDAVMATGFFPGDRTVRFGDVPAVVEGEERNPHNNTVEQYVRSADGKITRKVIWERTAPGETVIRVSKRVFE